MLQNIYQISQIVAAVGTIVGLIFVFTQIAQARKGLDLQTLQAFLSETKRFEDALINAKSDDFENAFFDFLNFLEVYSMALNRKLIPKVSREMITAKVIGSLAVIWANPDWHDRLIDGVTSKDTFSELGKVMKKNKKEILALVEAR